MRDYSQCVYETNYYYYRYTGQFFIIEDHYCHIITATTKAVQQLCKETAHQIFVTNDGDIVRGERTTVGVVSYNV